MSDCLFCKIVAGEIPATLVAENERFLAFADIAPTAPVHILGIPKTHHRNLSEYVSADPQEVAEFIEFLTEIGNQESPDGYRVVFNTDSAGGQTVFHIHGHVIGGRQMTWPAG